MKLRRYTSSLPAVLALLLFAAACGERANSMSVNPSEINLRQAGETMDIRAEAKNRRGAKIDGVTITYSSRDPSIANVSPTGTVTAVGHGSTTVVAQVEGTDVMDFVRVVIRLPDRIEVRPGSTTCYIGGVKNLKASLIDRSGATISNIAFEWSSSDETKARVDDGEVTGIDEGDATIYARALGLEGSSKVNVSWAPGQKALLEAEKRGSRGGRGGGARGGGGGGGAGGGGGGFDPRLSIFND